MISISEQRQAFTRRVERACKAADHHVTLINDGRRMDELAASKECDLCGFADHRIVGMIVSPTNRYTICSRCADYPEDDFICELIATLNAKYGIRSERQHSTVTFISTASRRRPIHGERCSKTEKGLIEGEMSPFFKKHGPPPLKVLSPFYYLRTFSRDSPLPLMSPFYLGESLLPG